MRLHRRPALEAGLALGLFTFAATGHADVPHTWVLEVSGARVEAPSGSASSDKVGNDSGVIAKAGGKHDEVILRGGAAMVRDLATVLGDGLNKDCPRNVNANLIAVGGDGNEMARLTFAWAILTELGLPALDGSASPASDVTLKLEPQFPKRVFQKGAISKPAAGPEWKRNGFKLAIEGLDGSLKAVKSIGELKISQAPSGGAPVTCSAPVVSDVTFTIPSADAAGLASWAGQRSGSIEYLAVDGSTILKVKLNGLKKKAQTAEGALAKVTMSVESVGLSRK